MSVIFGCFTSSAFLGFFGLDEEVLDVEGRLAGPEVLSSLCLTRSEMKT